MRIQTFGHQLASTLTARSCYGTGSHSLRHTALIASTILEREVTAREVGIILMALKLSRYSAQPDNEDHLLDAAGYCAVLSDADHHLYHGRDSGDTGSATEATGLDERRVRESLHSYRASSEPV